MYGLLNLSSLVLGLIAWTLPLVNLMGYKKDGHQNWAVLSMMSIGACATSLSFQIFYQHHLVTITDWSALMDTTDAVVFATTALLIGTILLNGISLLVYRGRTAK